MIKIFIIALLINNIVIMRYLALCSYVGMTSDVGQSVGMGFAVTFVTVLATAATWPLYHFILVPLHLEFLKILVFILVIAALVQLVEYYLKKNVPGLYAAMGIYLPLITTNCAVLGVAVLNIQKEYNLVQTTVFGFGAACGFGLAMLIFAGIRERMELCDIPVPFRGTAIGLITAGLLSLAFMGFTGLVKQ